MPALPFPHIVSTALVLLVAACAVFDRSGIAPDDASPPSPDAPPACTAGQDYCEGHVLVTCDENGARIAEEPCFLCDESGGAAQCLYASNVPAAVYDQCAETTHTLRPPAGSALNIVEPTADRIVILCSDDCGNGANAIEASHVVTDEGAWFCLSDVVIPGGVTVTYAGHIAEPIIWLVDGPVDIHGTVSLRGSGANTTTGGAPGPGGFAGANASESTGAMGQGPCAGSGGIERTSNGQDGGGGGGGGAFGGHGGNGGDGETPDGKVTAIGGVGGTACGSPTLVPLHGGSGGGGGADGACDTCGWPGGGGGGALAIAARSPISITGTLDASGGNGFGRTSNPGLGQGGGGGGGAGGALLLEAPMLSVAGNLVVDGGSGGASAAGNGGNGATADSVNGTTGTNAFNQGDGGGGGGGGGGRIRLNTPDGSFACANNFVSPAASCTAGGLPTVITPLSTP